MEISPLWWGVQISPRLLLAVLIAFAYVIKKTKRFGLVVVVKKPRKKITTSECSRAEWKIERAPAYLIAGKNFL